MSTPESTPESTPPEFTKEELKRAYKAFKRRLKLTRLDDESKLTHSLTTGRKSGVCAITPPDQYPQELWDELVRRGRLVYVGNGLYEPPPQS